MLGRCVSSLDIISIEESDDAVQKAVMDSESKAGPLVFADMLSSNIDSEFIRDNHTINLQTDPGPVQISQDKFLSC
jgi:hypothetical protein